MPNSSFRATGVSFSGHDEDTPLDLDGISEEAVRNLFRWGRHRTLSDDLARVGNCARPITLRGTSTRIDAGTNEVISTYDTRCEHDGVLLVRCGNRRDAICPACSRIYARDLYQMLKSGVAGGKTVPETVADNPLVFATFTAPSFGRVHNHATCGRNGIDQSCKKHGGHRVCGRKHTDDDDAIGQPLCTRCYRYDDHILWQWWAPELWRRFTIALRRELAKTLGLPVTRLADMAVVQYAKVAEYQKRGAIHFHALIRIDGPRKNGKYAPANPDVTTGMLTRAVRRAAGSVAFDVAHPAHYSLYTVKFGSQLDVRPVTATARPDVPGAGLSPSQVAGYLAKYSTKATGFDLANPTIHQRTIMYKIEDLVSPTTNYDDYQLLKKWAPALGFRGHFGTKSRAWSITLGALRAARARYQRLIAQNVELPTTQADLDELLLTADDHTTIVISDMRYEGSGWATHTEQALARAAAARAREYDQWTAHQRKERKQLGDKGFRHE